MSHVNALLFQFMFLLQGGICVAFQFKTAIITGLLYLIIRILSPLSSELKTLNSHIPNV